MELSLLNSTYPFWLSLSKPRAALRQAQRVDIKAPSTDDKACILASNFASSDRCRGLPVPHRDGYAQYRNATFESLQLIELCRNRAAARLDVFR
jgi:hypothetical protein